MSSEFRRRIFGFYWLFFEESSQNVIYVPKFVFGRDIIFDRNGYTWFVSLIERIFDFCIVLKTAFHVSRGFFWGKQSFNKTHKTYFFSDIEQETFQNLVNFFPMVFQNTINACRGASGGKDNYWVKPCQSWIKLLAWVSVLLSTWAGEPFDEKIASIFL